MKWILAQMLDMDVDSITVTTELSGSSDRPETIYLVSYPGGERRVVLRDVLEYIDKHLKDDPIVVHLPRR
ncbi:MAG: hypothetical protein JST90_04275 [Bacteroidetes bacterium]|nr:hypothetical protein [Bacteroidota bacterium]